jgi:CDP-paratose 2-epimerase
MRCAVTERPYTIFGYQGKQVRDNIHSQDLVRMFWEFYKAPKPGAVYNAGGGRFSNCSLLEAIEICQELTGRKMKTVYSQDARAGDHLWWISDMTKFKKDFPAWEPRFGIRDILSQIQAQANQSP